MGVIDKSERAAQTGGPDCPPIFLTTFEKYRALKFTRRVTDDEVKLYARDTLNWSDLLAYKDVTGQNISMYEVDLIMGLDAIFEGRSDV
jgi:hypothetical protein